MHIQDGLGTWLGLAKLWSQDDQKFSSTQGGLGTWLGLAKLWSQDDHKFFSTQGGLVSGFDSHCHLSVMEFNLTPLQAYMREILRRRAYNLPALSLGY